MERVLIPILGDQLSFHLSSLADADPDDTTILMMEVVEEATYVRHHPKKIAFLFAAMRHHAAALEEAGWSVDYVRLDDPDNAGSFTGEIARAVERHDPTRIVVTEAGEWRVQAMLEAWETIFGIPVAIRDAEGGLYLILRIGDDTDSAANPRIARLMAHEVTVDGELLERDGVRYLLVDKIADDKGVINLTHDEHGIQPFGN